MSELLNALNPNAVQRSSRTRQGSGAQGNVHVQLSPTLQYREHHQQQQQQQSPQSPTQHYRDHHQHHSPQAVGYGSHRSELDHAVVEHPSPQLIQPPVPSAPVIPDAVQEILRIVTATKEAADAERKRLIEWEHEQEAKFKEREAALEKQVQDMRGELSMLKEMIKTHSSAASSPTPSIRAPSTMPTLEQPFAPPASSPMSPVSQTSPVPPPMFIEGSSRHMIPPHPPPYPMPHPHPHPYFAPHPYPPPYGYPHTPPIFYPATPFPPTPSISDATPAISAAEPVSTSPVSSFPPTPLQAAQPSPALSVSATPGPPPPAVPANPRKRPADDEGDGTSSSNNERPESPVVDRPLKRINGHDSRCLTIHHAMRSHILRMMNIKTDKELPESYTSDEKLPDGSPIRFDWEKTPRRSPHNAEMRKRVLEDLKANRKLYKYVPEKDFEENLLEAAFDQVFTTFRQKFKAQKDARSAESLKTREETKAMKSRRAKRKKVKLASRTEMRKKHDAFAHQTFDAALTQECMSSEESCDEYTEPTASGAQNRVRVLRVRGLPWRSSRLLHFYTILDDSEKLETGTNVKPVKRNPTRQERCLGPPKDGFHMPPKGIRSWMVSQKWVRELKMDHPDMVDTLKELIVDVPGFDWESYDDLGHETEEEAEPEEVIPRSATSYSLAHALAHPG
ncbi:hypothetical protein K474DRAFT_1712761 [Panus rudis PR-1116 ss-1]|nr:hypothetical protein K474DRAFT_1712761 [Panus rudis PR-1116 ss-1]